MKNIALVALSVASFVAGLYFYGTFPRETRTYENMQPTELHAVLCIGPHGGAESFHIIIPSFEGFSTEDTRDLEASYKQGFCDSIK